LQPKYLFFHKTVVKVRTKKVWRHTWKDLTAQRLRNTGLMKYLSSSLYSFTHGITNSQIYSFLHHTHTNTHLTHKIYKIQCHKAKFTKHIDFKLIWSLYLSISAFETSEHFYISRRLAFKKRNNLLINSLMTSKI